MSHRHARQKRRASPREAERTPAAPPRDARAPSPKASLRLRRAAIIALLTILLVLWFKPALDIHWASWRSHSPSFDMARAVATLDAWKGGLWDARWFAAFDWGFGYPFLSFYAPLFSWGAALLLALGLSPPVAVVLHLMLWLALGTAGTFLAANRFWRHVTRDRSPSLFPGLIASCGWLLSPYLVCNVYVRGDGPEFLSSQTLPWILYAALGILLRHEPWSRRDARDLLVGFMALVAGILGHNFLAMAALGKALAFLPLAALLRSFLPPQGAAPSGRVLRARAAAWLGTCLWALAATAFFWWPALREGEYVRTATVAQGYFHYAKHFLDWSNFADIGFWGFGASVPPPEKDSMPLHLGYVSALAVAGLVGAGVICALRRQRQLGAATGLTFGFGLVSASLTHEVSKPLWELVPILQLGQFPWRLLSVPTLAIALLLPAFPVTAAVAFSRPRDATWRRLSLATFALALLGCAVLSRSAYLQPILPDPLADVYANLELWHRFPVRTTSSDEYGPRWRPTDRNYPSQPGVWMAFAGAPQVEEASKARPEPSRRPGGVWQTGDAIAIRAVDNRRYALDLDVENTSGERQSLFVGFNYYPAWKVAAEPEAPELSLAPTESGYIEIRGIPPGRRALRLWFGNTPARAAAKVFSAAAWLLLAAGGLALALGSKGPPGTRKDAKTKGIE